MSGGMLGGIVVGVVATVIGGFAVEQVQDRLSTHARDEFVEQVDALLLGRHEDPPPSITSAMQAVAACRLSPDEAAERVTIANDWRRAVLPVIRHMGDGVEGEVLEAYDALFNAYQASIRANDLRIAWLRTGQDAWAASKNSGAGTCPTPVLSRDLAAADEAATKAKETFIAIYNPIASLHPAAVDDWDIGDV